MPTVSLQNASMEQIAACRRPGGGVDMEKLQRLVAGEDVAEAPAQLDPAVLGEDLPDMYEGLTFDARSPARLRLLQQIGSPFVDGGDACVLDVAQALYVLTADWPELSPLLLVAQLDDRIAFMESAAQQDHWARVLADLIARRELAWAEWQQAAYAYLEEYAADPDEAAERIQQALHTAQQVMQGRSRVSDPVDAQTMLEFARETGIKDQLREARERRKQQREDG
jgi:hypothetical protein